MIFEKFSMKSFVIWLKLIGLVEKSEFPNFFMRIAFLGYIGIFEVMLVYLLTEIFSPHISKTFSISFIEI